MINLCVYIPDMLSILKKIRSRGFFWLMGRLLQESENSLSATGRIIKPVMMILYPLILFPLKQYKSQSNKKKIPKKDTLYLLYDLDVAPVTFDFAWALALAEKQRKKMRLEKIHVVFVPGTRDGLRTESPDYEQSVDLFAREWRRIEILHHLCNILPSCKGVTTCSSRNDAQLLCDINKNYIYPTRYSVTLPITHTTSELLAHSTDVMVFKASVQAKRYLSQWLNHRLKNRKLITITLRNSAYMPARNSNVPEWIKFVKMLDLSIYFPIFIPDTDSAFDEDHNTWKDLVLFTDPAWNLHLRAALYEMSYLNLGVNNGVMVVCWLNAACRYITFKMMVADAPQTVLQAMKKQGFEYGTSLSFANSKQKWVWEDDNADIIMREFRLMCVNIEK